MLQKHVTYIDGCCITKLSIFKQNCQAYPPTLTCCTIGQSLLLFLSYFAHTCSVTKSFIVSKGAKFSTSVAKQDTDLTPEMIAR